MGLTPRIRRGFPPRTTTPLAIQTAYAKYRVASNVCVHAREFQVAPSCYNGRGGPPSFSRPFGWFQADAKPPKRATESRWATTARPILLSWRRSARRRRQHALQRTLVDLVQPLLGTPSARQTPCEPLSGQQVGSGQSGGLGMPTMHAASLAEILS